MRVTAISRYFRGLAGTPATRAPAATSRVTTEPGCHHRAGAHLDAGHEDAARPDPAAAPQRRSPQREVFRMAGHRVVVGRGHSRADDDVLLDGGPGGHVGARPDPGPCADRHVVVDRRARPDRHAHADLRALAHERALGHDGVLAKTSAGEHHRSRLHPRPGTHPQRGGRVATRARRRGQAGSLAEHDGVPEHHAVANLGPGVHHDVGAALSRFGHATPSWTSRATPGAPRARAPLAARWLRPRGRGAVAYAGHEVLALDPQRLDVVKRGLHVSPARVMYSP